jgi:hypothetical protein
VSKAVFTHYQIETCFLINKDWCSYRYFLLYSETSKGVLIVTAELKIYRLRTLRRTKFPTSSCTLVTPLRYGKAFSKCNALQWGSQTSLQGTQISVRILFHNAGSLKRLEYSKSRIYFAVSLVTRFSLSWDVSQRKLVGFYLLSPIRIFFDCLTLEDGTDRLFRNVDNYQSSLSNTPEERRSCLHRGGSLKSRKVGCFAVHKNAA